MLLFQACCSCSTHVHTILCLVMTPSSPNVSQTRISRLIAHYHGNSLITRRVLCVPVIILLHVERVNPITLTTAILFTLFSCMHKYLLRWIIDERFYPVLSQKLKRQLQGFLVFICLSKLKNYFFQKFGPYFDQYCTVIGSRTMLKVQRKFTINRFLLSYKFK